MAKIECWFKQDLLTPVKIRTLTGSVFTLDNVGSLIGVEVYKNGVAETLTGSVTGYCILPEGTTVSVAGSRDGNKAYIALPQSALAYPGLLKIAVKLTNDSEITTLLAVMATVSKSRTDAIITPSQQVITDWSQQIAAEIQNCADARTNLAGIVAPAFAEGTANAAGTYVTYNGNMYLLPSGHTAGTTWANTSKTQVTAGGQLVDLKSAINAQMCPVEFAPNTTNGSYYKFADGSTGSSTKYARTNGLWAGYGSRSAVFLNSNVYECAVFYYDATGTTSGTGYQGHDDYSPGVHYIPEIAVRIGVSFRRIDQAVLTTADITAISAAFSAYAPTDTTLTKRGMAADAAATGRHIADLKSALNAGIESCENAFTDSIGNGDSLVMRGYSSLNNMLTSINLSPYVPDINFEGLFITRIRMNVDTVGTLTIGYYPLDEVVTGNTFDRNKFRMVKTIKTETTGDQTIILDGAVYIPKGYNLAICDRENDTLRFCYGPNGTTKGFFFNDSGLFAYSQNSLGIDIYCIENIENGLIINELIKSSMQIDNVMEINGYDTRNSSDSNLNLAPFFPRPLIQNKVVTGAKFNASSTGAISFGIYHSTSISNGGTYDPTKYERKLLYTVSETGEQTVTFDVPIYVPEGAVFCIGSSIDSVEFKYGSNGNNKRFYFKGAGNIFELSNNSLGFDVYTARGKIAEIASVETGKKMSIYGDSISTFAGWIPEGNAVYYTGSNAGVSTVNDTWWMKTIKALGYELLVNNSWSGRAVSSIRDQSSGHTTDAGYKEANVLQLKSGDVLPDVIIVKLGINDFDSECPLGTYDGSTALPTDPSTFTNAYAMMLNLIMTNFPLAKVYCCTLMAAEENGSIGFPEINGNGESLTSWNNAIKQLAHAFGASVLEHDICGITYYNISTYMGDYSSSTKKGLHPNAAGHSLIANQTIHDIDNAVRVRY